MKAERSEEDTNEAFAIFNSRSIGPLFYLTKFVKIRRYFTVRVGESLATMAYTTNEPTGSY
jgi:hypothetical protein